MPKYEGLGAFVLQENPYALVEGTTEIDVLNPMDMTEFPEEVAYPGLTDAEKKEREAEFRSTRMIRRAGWLADHCVWDPQQGVVGPVSEVEDPGVPRSQLYFLVDGEGNYLKDPNGTTIQFTKVILIPYRWRRPETGWNSARQTYFAICYSGPSSR